MIKKQLQPNFFGVLSFSIVILGVFLLSPKLAKAASVSLSPSLISPSGDINVAVSEGPGNAGDWVGLYLASAPQETGNYVNLLAWKYLDGTLSTPAAGQSSANLTFIAPSTSGSYHVRFFADNGTQVLATSNNITVGTAQTPPPPPSTPSTILNPGDNIQAAIDFYPEGTTFTFTPGVYRLPQALVAKNNDIFISQQERGAILSGAKLLTSFTLSQGSIWFAQNQTQENPSRPGNCEPVTYTGCKYADAVFLDDQALWRVTSLAELASGKFYFDYAADRIYLGDNPAGRKVEAAVTRQAFRGYGTGVSNVTIQGLVIEKFSNEYQICALEARADWTILNNEVRLNHGTGICEGGIVKGNFVHHNGQMGMGGGYGSFGMLVENNEISFNNQAGFDFSEAGGTKWVHTTNLIVRGNYAHDNKGPGLWTDADNTGTLYENNHTQNNFFSGIFHEISFDAIIRNNLLENDGFAPGTGTDLWKGECIAIVNSSNVEVYGNIIRHCMNGIGAINAQRGSNPSGVPLLTKNLNVHDNLVLQDSNYAAGLVSDIEFTPDIFTSWNNRFSNNTYCLPNPAAQFYYWQNAPKTKTEWSSYGNDVNSQVYTTSNCPSTPGANKHPRTITLSALEGLSTVPQNQIITATILSGSTVLETHTLSPNAQKQYTVTFLSTGPQLVDIRISVPKYLSRKLIGIDTTVNSTSVISVAQLLAGDLNSDNTINSIDYSLLNSNWNQSSAAADLNGDAFVNSLDFAILKNNFNKVGE